MRYFTPKFQKFSRATLNLHDAQFAPNI